MKQRIPIRIDLVDELITCECGETMRLPWGMANWMRLVSPFLAEHKDCNGYRSSRKKKRASGAFARRVKQEA